MSLKSCTVTLKLGLWGIYELRIQTSEVIKDFWGIKKRRGLACEDRTEMKRQKSAIESDFFFALPTSRIVFVSLYLGQYIYK